MNIKQIKRLDKLFSQLFGRIQRFLEGEISSRELKLSYSYDLYSFLYKIIGSVDYFNKITLKPQNLKLHPLSLTFIEDEIDYGYINAEVNNYAIEDKNVKRIKDDNYNEETFYLYAPPIILSWTGSTTENITTLPIEYPAWEGWQNGNGSNPIGGANNDTILPVFMNAAYITIKPETEISTNDILEVNIIEELNFSKWNNYDDIKLYHFADYDAQKTPLLSSVAECKKRIENNKLYFQPIKNIPAEDKHFFILYWSSPDSWIQNNPSPEIENGITFAGNYEIIKLPYVNYFFSQRVDLLQFKNPNPILKARNRTFSEFNEQDERIYSFEDPVYYPMDKLSGTLDETIQQFYADSSGRGTYFPELNIQQLMSFILGGFSADYKNKSGYPDPEAVFGVTIGIISQVELQKSYGATPRTRYSYKKGPEIFPDMFPDQWKNFEYFPDTPHYYIPYIKLIVGQIPADKRSGNSPRAVILYMEYTKNYASDCINNIKLVKELENTLIQIYQLATSENSKYIMPTIAFESYFAFLALQNKFIDNTSILFAHKKYETQGFTINTANVPRQLSNSILSGISGGKKTLSTEILATNARDTAWFQNIFYWNCPKAHGADHFQFDHYSNWMVAYARGIDTSTKYINYLPGNEEAGLAITNRKIFSPINMEIYIKDTGQPNTTDLDLTINIGFRDFLFNRIYKKNLFLPASKYYLTNAERERRELDDLESTDGYIYPDFLNSLKEYQMFGEQILLSNLRKGQTRTIEMKYLDPDDPDLPTMEEFIQDWINKNAGDEIDWQDLRDAIQYQEENGGFDKIDLRTLTNRAILLDEFWLAATTYTKGNVYWNYSADWQTRGYSNYPSTRYGYKVNGLWNYQNFDFNNVTNNRIEYMQSHLGFPFYNNYQNSQMEYIVKKQTNHDLHNYEQFALNGTLDYLAQTFTADFSETVTKIINIELYLERLGMQEDLSLALYVYNTKNSAPFGSPLNANPALVSFNDVPKEGGWINFQFEEPIKLPNNKEKRYAIVLSTVGPTSTELNEESLIAWHYASINTYAYSISNTITYLTESEVTNENGILVENATIFPDVPFFVAIEGDIYYIVSIQENALKFDEYIYNEEHPGYHWHICTDDKEYSIGAPVSLVSFIPLDPEQRWNINRIDEYGLTTNSWQEPEQSNYDAAYKIIVQSDNVGPIEEVSIYDWFGDDLEEESEKYADIFYIVPESTVYDVTQGWGGNMLGLTATEFVSSEITTGQPQTLVSLSFNPRSNNISLEDTGNGSKIPIMENGYVFGGFNTPGMEGFPAANSIRAHPHISSNNKVDGYWAWNTIRSKKSERIKLLLGAALYKEDITDENFENEHPNAIIIANGDSRYKLYYEYIPIKNNIYLTIGLLKADGSRKVINKFIPGYVHAFGTISGMSSDAQLDPAGEKTYTVTSNLTANQVIYKKFKVVSGTAQGTNGIIIGNTANSITLMEPLHTIPSINDEYYIEYSGNAAVWTGNINSIDLSIANNLTTIFVDDSWTPDEFNGDLLWIIEDSSYKNKTYSILSSTENSLIIQGLYDLAQGTRIAIITIDPDMADNFAEYATTEPIILDDEKFIGIDHLHINKDKFPSDSWNGHKNGFMIKSSFNILPESK